MKNASILLDRTLDFLNGNVKIVIRKKYELKNDSKQLKEYYLKEYNTIGIRTKTIRYDSDGAVKLEQISEFDSRGLKVGYTNFDKNGFADSVGSYDIDSKGNILKKYFDGGLEEIFSYDNHGRLIEQIYAKSGDRIIYSYDKEEKLIIEQTNYQNEVKTFLVKFTNDSNGNILKTETYKIHSMELLHTQISVTNNKGDEIEAYVILKNGDKVNWKKYDYEYDSMGNWTKRVYSSVVSNSKEIDERLIEYHS